MASGHRSFFLHGMKLPLKLCVRIYPDPDPIKQDLEGWPDASSRVAPLAEQPYILQLVRLATAAQFQGNTPQFFHHVGRRIWGTGQDWTKFLEKDVDAAGMD